MLYLENDFAAHTFTPERLAVMNLLATQAAISLENARLYDELRSENVERKRAEDARRQFQRQHEMILNSITEGIHWIDGEGRIIFENPAAARMLGWEVSDLMGRPAHETMHHTYADGTPYPQCDCHIYAGLRTGAACRVDDEVFWRKDGTSFPVEYTSTPVRREDGVVIGVVVVFADITERKRAEEERRRWETSLRKAQGELAHMTRVTTMGELAASIAHEVNQPIAGVVLNGNACLRWLAWLKEDSTNLDEAREAVQRIIRDAGRAGEIITRIRALFRKADAIKEPLNLNGTIREVIVLARAEIDKKRIALQLQLARDLPAVLGDKVQLQQVILNLILNAIDAMSSIEGGARELIIRTETREETEVKVTVRDSGHGLDIENAEQIFNAFHTTKPDGLGMGLSISRSIIERHSGRLWATANEGPGATFHFTLLTHSPQDLPESIEEKPN